MKDLQEQYLKEESWGLLTSIDLHHCHPELIRNAEAIRKYVNQLCQLIKMKKFGSTKVVYFGQEESVAGYSMVQFIETSLISGHFANQTNHAYIDIFSCQYYDPEQAAHFTKEYFQAEDMKIHTLLRK